MTFEVHFYAEQALLFSVKCALASYPKDDEYPQKFLAVGASSILSCQAALEAIVNSLIQRQGRLTHWDRLSLLQKIDTIAELSGESIDWGKVQWKRVRELIKVRNWLAHSKKTYVGLSGFEDEWIVDRLNKNPRVDPEIQFTEKSVREYYNSVRQVAFELSKIVQVEEEYQFLETEYYEPLVS